MKIAVRYHSRTGNTEKLARAIAEEVGVEAETLGTPLSEKADILFLGSAVYAAGVDKEVKRFLEANKENIGVLYAFSTAAILASTYKQVKKLAEKQGITVAAREFHCRGKFAFMHKNHPDAEDLESAAQFAKEVVQGEQR